MFTWGGQKRRPCGARTYLNRPSSISCGVSGGGDGTKAHSRSRPKVPGTTEAKAAGSRGRGE